MKKISKLDWGNYIESPKGKETVSTFDKLTNSETSLEELFELIQLFDSAYCKNTSPKEKQQCIECLGYYNEEINSIISEIDELKNEGTYLDYKALSCILLADSEEQEIDDIPQSRFKAILSDSVFLSIILSRYFPEYYIPNLFVMQFYYLRKIAEKYEIELPSIPCRSDYRSRWLYYTEMCQVLNEFAIENEIRSLSELCAFLYGYEISKIKEEMDAEHQIPFPSIPEHARILVGNYGEAEKTMKEGVWQSSQLTCKGDILLFYEKSPVKKMNSVWIALEDGFVDPFAFYYSYTIIGRKIVIPDNQAITFEEFKNNEYFKKRDKEGNFVSKNFQDVSGWLVTSKDYTEIKRMLEIKGFNTSILPSLYEPKTLVNEEIKNEKDVEEYRLKPLLDEMKIEYEQQVEFPAGHGTTGHRMDKRPDFCLHLSGSGSLLTTKVVIEVKYFMKDNTEIEDTFNQGVTYAKWGEAQVLVLCDKNQIRVYERRKKGGFNSYDMPNAKFRWEDKENLEKFNELKRMLNI